MKILLSNKYYYRRGGDCVYTINLEQLLKSKGHEVAIFAMDHPQNIYTPWSKYFPSEVKFTSGINILKTILRPFGTKEVKQKFSHIIKDFQPDIVHINNIHSQLSPIIAEIAHKQGIRVIWTLHDYKLICSRSDCLMNDTTCCELCMKNRTNIIRYKCNKHSILASILGYAESLKWDKIRIENITDIMICPSIFIKNQMIKQGFNSQKLFQLYNFINDKQFKNLNNKKENYYCYIGRISEEKGLKTLIKVANELPYKLKIVGDGPLLDGLKKVAKSNIEFLGYRNWQEIKDIEGKAKFSVIPSEWYENNPLNAIESLCLGTPILGSDLGGLPELTQKFDYCDTFIHGNYKDFNEKINKMMNTKICNYLSLSDKAIRFFNQENYYNKLIKIYSR